MNKIAVILAAAILPVAACSPDRRAGYEKKCTNDWKDSGYETRLVYSTSGNSIVGTEYFSCQVRINGRWIPAENVRVGS